MKDSSLNNIDDDKFRYQDFANNLRKIIEYNEVPFIVAIVGKWGLGKSSLVNMALAPLRKEEKEFLILCTSTIINTRFWVVARNGKKYAQN